MSKGFLISTGGLAAMVFIALVSTNALGVPDPETSTPEAVLGDAPPDDEVQVAQSLSAVQAILNANCIRCHGGASPAAGQDLSAGAAHSSLVNHPATGGPGLDRVEPGQPENSYMFLKITNQHLARGGRGRQMPLGEDPLSQRDIRTIREWILAGAPR